MFGFFKNRNKIRSEENDITKIFADALNDAADAEMEKLTPSQRAQAEEFGKVFSEEFKKLDQEEQEKVWNKFAEAYRQQKTNEWKHCD